VTIPVLGNDYDPDGDPLSVSIVSGPDARQGHGEPRRHDHLHPEPRLLRHRLLHLQGLRPLGRLRYGHGHDPRHLRERCSRSPGRYLHHERGHAPRRSCAWESSATTTTWTVTRLPLSSSRVPPTAPSLSTPMAPSPTRLRRTSAARIPSPTRPTMERSTPTWPQ